MKDRDITRLTAGASLAGILALHWLPKRLLPFASPVFAAALVIGGLLVVHRNPIKMLRKDFSSLIEGAGKTADSPV